MDIVNLKHFLAIIDNKSFSKAALEENISQSSLSKHIMNLERELQVTLFDRNTHKLQLTEAGQIFASYAENFLMQYNLMMNSLDNYRNYEINVLRIMSMPILHLYDISEMILAFRKNHPMDFLQIIETMEETIISAMERQTVDVAIVRQTTFPQKSNHSLYNLIYDELYLVCSTRHRFARSEELEFSDITNEHFILLTPSILDFLAKLIEKHDVHINFERNSTLLRTEQDIEKHLHENLSVMLLSGAAAEKFAENPNLVAIRFKEHISFALTLAIDSRNQSRLVQDFIEHAFRYFEERGSAMPRILNE